MNGHVMIIDPSQYDSDMIRKLLIEMGVYHITAVQSYEQFVLVEESIDTAALIIMDIGFPTVAEGAKLLKRIRENPKFVSTPIVIATALDEYDAKGIGLDYSVVDYIVKPFKPDRFLNSISALLVMREDFIYRFTHTPAIQLSPMEYIEREVRIAGRLESFMSLIVISPLNSTDDASAQGEIPDKTGFMPQLMLNTVQKNLRVTDQAFLNDNGEVLAVLPATDVTGAEKALEKIIAEVRKHLLNQEFKDCDDYYGVSVSYPQDGKTLNELMHTAFSKINSKKQLEKVTSSVDKRMAQAQYVYKKSQKYY